MQEQICIHSIDLKIRPITVQPEYQIVTINEKILTKKCKKQQKNSNQH